MCPLPFKRDSGSFSGGDRASSPRVSGIQVEADEKKLFSVPLAHVSSSHVMKRQKVINYGKSGDVTPPPAKKLALAAPLISTSPNPVAPSTSSSPLNRTKLPSSSLQKAASTSQTPIAFPKPSESEELGAEIHYEVLWNARSSKVHKIRDNGTLKVLGNRCTLYDTTGAQMATTITYSASKLADLKEEEELRVGDKELIVQGRISKVERDGREKVAKDDQTNGVAKPQTVSKVATAVKSGPLHATSKAPVRTARAALKLETLDKNRFILCSGVTGDGRPTEVVLEPFLRDVMRPHQLEGVRFMYECVTGMREHATGPTTGCILADVMGLGKTLQTIALLRTLANQNPNGSTVPLVKKSIVVTPVSLVVPWSKEVTKWLGRERMAPVVISEIPKAQAAELIRRFKDAVDEKLLIISYEQLRIHLELLKQISFGLVVCDEGHRLKNPSSKLSQDLLSLNIPRRVILSGTPFQNNLSEYYALVDFVNPESLGTPEEFRARFDRPISASKVRGASSAVVELGTQRSSELISLSNCFVLRRTSAVLEAFLPQKHEVVVFCKPTKQQISSYTTVLSSLGLCDSDLTERELKEDEAVEANMEEWDGDGRSALAAMTQLSKICNHPSLLLPKDDSTSFTPLQVSISEILLGDQSDDDSEWRSRCSDAKFSGKFLVLQQMLELIRATTKDKVVIVSSFTKTLDLVGSLARQKDWKSVRLDGSTDAAHRNHAIEQFQRDPSVFLFLLSTKAGGAGLNLFAANRLVLFDSCWNPAFDTQAQARIWRDGQTKPTWIYRFLTTGMLDEKIFQRQLVKNDMGRTVLDEASVDGEGDDSASKRSKSESTQMSASSFSLEDLQDVFSINLGTRCDTHDISGCTCTGGKTASKKSKKLSHGEISDWEHLPDARKFADPILAKASADLVTFLFSKSTHPASSSAP